MEKKSHREIMNYALELAKQCGEWGEVPVGAVIAKDGIIISTGQNRREKDRNALYHAETEAIDSACKKLNKWRLDDCTLYVTLEPCSMCAGAILNARIKKVVFGAYDYKAGCFGGLCDFSVMKFPYVPEIQGGFMENECKEPIDDFFKNIRIKKEH